jgi:NADH-quinone oxidoreductase subunit N
LSFSAVLAQTPPTVPGVSVDGPTPTESALATPSVDWSAVAPLLILGVGALLLLTITSLVKRRGLPAGFLALWTVVAAIAAGLSTIPLWFRVVDDGPFTIMGGALGIDGFGLFVIGVLCCAVVLGALVADGYLRREGLEGPELFVLLLLAALGGAVMATADDLIVLFLGLETLSIAAYVLAAMHVRRIESQEAGLKYFVLGGFSSAFFLYGIAFIYGATGSTNLVHINAFLSENLPADNGLLLLGFGFMLVGLGFKVAAVPFHSWAPDVYQGSPTPVVAFMASGVKAAAFAGLIRVFFLTFGTYRLDWQPVVFVLAVLSLFVGAVLAIVQSDVKRMLAYSSISHAGFILVGVQVATEDGVTAVLFYLAAYTFMVAGSFGVVTLVSRRGDNHTGIDDYRGLAKTNPQLAFFFTIFLLAQAGVPFTVGFFAKFYVISAAAESESYALAIIAMVTAVIAAFLYLRIIVAMYMNEPPADELEPIEVPFGAGLAIGLCFAVTVFFGIFPSIAFDWASYGKPELVEYTVDEPAVPLPTDIPIEGFGE